MLMNIQAVIFDLDGVIVSTDTYHFRAWKRIAEGEGIYFDEVINNRLRGVSRAESLEIILERAQRQYTPEEKEDLGNYVNDIRSQLNISILMVEHDMSLVMQISDRVCVLNYGRVIAEGVPATVQKNDQVIKAYLGEENGTFT